MRRGEQPAGTTRERTARKRTARGSVESPRPMGFENDHRPGGQFSTEWRGR
ncbi:hypothetical protein A33M_2863 [Rhodovulum sp. PH10]|nr:hypothetical protein A33M_2863 [Rhodovulum sp. PH10]